MYFFTSDEHMDHKNIIKYCNRPFNNIEDMNECIIKRHNDVVKKNDTVFHIGDYTFIPNKKDVYKKFINRLNGIHIFIYGSHDKWLKGNKDIKQIYEITIEKQPIIMCHYPMFLWPRSHYNSWHLFGHSHHYNTHFGKTLNVCADIHNFYPISFEQLKNIMDNKPNNPDFLGDRK